MSDTSPVLLRDDRHGVAHLTLNRPDSFNALSAGLIASLQSELDNIAGDSEVRVVVIGGAGRAFCAGHDLKEIRAMDDPQAIRDLFSACSRMMTTLTEIPQPVIAKVGGIATAAGCQLVAQCDLAIASETAKFATSGISIGLFCATPMVPLTRNLSRKQAMEMLLTGDFIDAETAMSSGLINRTEPPDALDEGVSDLAGRIARHSPAAISFGKRLFYKQLESGLEGAYKLAGEVMARNLETEDAKAGMDAFIEKRQMPAWKGR